MAVITDEQAKETADKVQSSGVKIENQGGGNGETYHHYQQYSPGPTYNPALKTTNHNVLWFSLTLVLLVLATLTILSLLRKNKK